MASTKTVIPASQLLSNLYILVAYIFLSYSYKFIFLLIHKNNTFYIKVQENINVWHESVKFSGLELLQEDKVELLWAGKKLLKGKQLCDYIGKIEKTKVNNDSCTLC